MAKLEKPETASAGTENQNPEIVKPDTVEADSGDSFLIDESLEAIGDTLTQQMPEVQEHAIEQEKSKQDAVNAEYASITDRFGTPFDANLHKTNKEGEPTLTNQGNCILKPASKGAPKKSAGGGSVIGGRAGGAQVTAQDAQKVQARASGAMAANLLLTLGIVAGGDEWQPINDPANGINEKQMLEGAFADYFEATGKTDIPPSMALVVAIGAYSLPRFTMPKTQSRVGKLKTWIVKKFADRKLKKHGLKAESSEKRNRATEKDEG